MGEVIRVSTKLLKPTQPDLLEDFWIHRPSLRKIICAYVRSRENEIPMPTARFYGGFYNILDGHKRSAVADLFLGECFLYLPDEPEDKITPDKMTGYAVQDKADLDWTNHLISSRWDEIIDDCILSECPYSMKNMRRPYDFLKDVESAKRYFKIED